ncbi:hypothetical protein U1Q18_030867 [Sarracenia purpurea var. burkii]
MEEQYFGWGSVMEEEEEKRWRKGPWTAEEDRLLFEYVKFHGEGRWNSVAKLTVQSLQPHDQVRQDMETLNANNTTEDYQVLFSPQISGYAEDPSEDSILWDGGLWNLGPV